MTFVWETLKIVQTFYVFLRFHVTSAEECFSFPIFIGEFLDYIVSLFRRYIRHANLESRDVHNEMEGRKGILFMYAFIWHFWFKV